MIGNWEIKKNHVDYGCRVVLFAVEASALGSGRPCGVYMFSGLTVLVFDIYNITETILLCTCIQLIQYIVRSR